MINGPSLEIDLGIENGRTKETSYVQLWTNYYKITWKGIWNYRLILTKVMKNQKEKFKGKM